MGGAEIHRAPCIVMSSDDPHAPYAGHSGAAEKDAEPSMFAFESLQSVPPHVDMELLVSTVDMEHGLVSSNTALQDMGVSKDLV